MKLALLLFFAACSSSGGAAADLATPTDLTSTDHAMPPLFCQGDTCPSDQYCVEECRGPQHCIPIPRRCQPISASVTSCSCLDADPCRAAQPCFAVHITEQKVRCLCE